MEKLLSAVPELARIFMISIVVDAAIWLSLAEFHSIPVHAVGRFGHHVANCMDYRCDNPQGTQRDRSREGGFKTAS
jgi:hypothetical protein